jgi:hypothetical protein
MTAPFFWLHVKKAGGTSFRATFTPPYVQSDRKAPPRPFPEAPRTEWNDMVNNFRIPLGEYDFRRMLFARDHLYGAEEFGRMFRFVIVRNPYERSLSCWRYLTGGTGGSAGFERFLETLSGEWASKHNRHLATHTAPVWPDITDGDGNLLVEAIYKLEEMDDVMHDLCARLGVSPRSFQHANASDGKRLRKEFLTPRAKALVESLYADDLRGLGYR